MLSIAPGYDPRYLTRQVGLGAENYYLTAVLEHGEPPGIWWGPGAAELGLEPGSEIDGKVMETLYGKFLDPRDPEFLDPEIPDDEKARLGRRKSEFKSWKEIYETSVAAEPEASEERRQQLLIAAKGQARQSVIHHDATFSPVKSVTMVHAGLLAAAQSAEKAGDVALAGQYRQAADVVWEGVSVGAAASLRYLQENAGEARAGYHGAKVAGRSTGRWVEAGGWVVARFRQHTNREGEPQLHVHQAILNRQLCADGKWRGLDGMALYRVRPAAAAHGERVMEEHLTRRLGLEWRSRPDGQGREVVGVSPEVIAEFSSRRAQVTEYLRERVDAYVAAHGRQPSPRVLFRLSQEATKETKRAKPKAKQVPSPAEQLRSWEERTTAKEIQRLSQIPAKVLGRFSPKRAEQARQALADLQVGKVIASAIADAQRDKAAFTRYELTRHLNRHLPDSLGGLPAERVEALLEELTDMAVDPAGPQDVRLLTAPDVVNIPEELQRADGRSRYLAQAAERYTTADQLDREAALTASALAGGAPCLTAERAAELVGFSMEQAKQALLRGEAVPDAAEPRPYRDQADALVGILSSERRVDVLEGAAGTGKSFTVSRLASIWREAHGQPVIGLATAQNAANVLKREGLDEASNITRWLQAVDDGETSVRRGQLIVVDETSMATTEHLVRIQQLADAAGAKVVWTGDSAQLAAPGAGGAMRRLVEVGGSEQLSTVVRFRQEWERDASLKLREGLAEVLTDYDQHGRLQDGAREDVETAALRGYLADFLQGKQSLLLAGTNAKAAELSGRVRGELVALNRVDAEGVRLHDGNTAGRGDLIMARRNVIDEDASIGTRVDELTNRDVLRVGHIDEDGRIVARILDDKGRHGEAVCLEPDYVRKYVELGYAGTVHAAEGRTVDTCHSVVDETGTRQMAYVMLTRGRDGNYAYVVADRVRESDLRPGPEQAAEAGKQLLGAAERDPLRGEAARGGVEQQAERGDRISVLSAVLEADQADQTAVEAMLEEGERPRHLAHLGSMMIDQIREHSGEAFIDRAEASGALSPSDAARLRSDEAAGNLGRLLHSLRMSGRDADRILAAAIGERSLAGADSVAQVLHWRITTAAADRGINVDRLEVGEEQVRGSWRKRIPFLGRPRTDRLLGEIGAWMDMRQYELGQGALERPPGWLVEMIGAPHPDDVVERGLWAERAGRVLGYREQYGHHSEVDPIGPAPSRKNPEQRASYLAAHDALGQPDASREISGATDGELWVMRAGYERDARWAPPYVGDELGRVSTEARERAGEAVRLRARADAVTVHDPAAAAGLRARAVAEETLAATLRGREAVLTEIHQARQAWHEQTKDSALLAGRADAELRRRDHIDASMLPPLHVDQADTQIRLEQLRAAERQARAERSPEVMPGQMMLDLQHPDVQRAGAWRSATGQESPELIEQRRRLDWLTGELDRVRAEQLPESVADRQHEELLQRQLRNAQRTIRDLEELHAAAHTAEVDEQTREQAPGWDVPVVEPPAEAVQEQLELHELEPEPGREEVAGQLALDILTAAGRQVDREEDHKLADALDKARAARAIAEVRQIHDSAELDGPDAEQHRRRREAERQTAEATRQEVERTDAERARLEERTRERSAAELAADSFPLSPTEALRASRQRRDAERQHEQPEHYRHHQEPGRDLGGPGL